MKTLLYCFLLVLPVIAYSQQIRIKEPEFNGTVVFVNDTVGDGLKLEQQQYVMGFGKIEGHTTINHYFEGTESSVKIKKENSLRFIVRFSNSQSLAPSDFIKIYKVDLKKKTRYLIFQVGNNNNNDEPYFIKNTLIFDSKKYGKESYLVELSNLEPGHYAFDIMLSPKYYLFDVIQ